MSSTTIRRTLPGIVRVLISSILLSALFAACLYLYDTAFPPLHEQLLDTGKKTTAWFVEQLSFSLPFIILCLYFTIAYHGLDHRDGVASREKMWITILTTLVVYLGFLPYLNHLSGEMYAEAIASGATVPESEGGVPWTLMMRLHDWFIRLSIPMAIVITFYSMRSSRERRCPDEPEAPLMTVEEYNAMMSARAASETPVEENADVTDREVSAEEESHVETN